jgi:hypothetical protein
MLIFFSAKMCLASEIDYRQIYLDMEVPSFSYIHNLDPDEYYNNKNSTWSPYPLFRLCSPIYFKTISIPPSYYLLSPTVHDGKDYVLFKEFGQVRYIIPVYKKEFVPEGFYEAHIPKPKLKLSKKISNAVFGFIGKHVKSAQKKPTPQTYLEVNDLDNNFVCVVVYYGPYRYYLLFRTIQL